MRALTEVTAAAEVLPGPSTPGSVTAEIGNDRGALVVHVPADWAGREVEIRPVGGPWTGTHVAVLPRCLGARVDHCAFFPSLPDGVYELRPIAPHGPTSHQPLGSEVRSVRVTGAEVADITW